MIRPDIREKFGAAGRCDTFTQVLELMRSETENRRSTAAFGMALCAAQAAKSRHETYYHNTLEVLDELARGKAELDIAGWHGIVVAHTTAAILLAAQQYFDREVIPCTEWPTASELSLYVLSIAHTLLV